jgi:Leucine-rich repeat (LRR) protein
MISLEILQSVLRHIFVERTVEIQDAQVWSRLATAACPCNGMVLMDESLQLLPAVEALDLSRNNLAKVANLQKCLRLKFLDLGFNHITSVASLNEVQVQIIKYGHGYFVPPFICTVLASREEELHSCPFRFAQFMIVMTFAVS